MPVVNITKAFKDSKSHPPGRHKSGLLIDHTVGVRDNAVLRHDSQIVRIGSLCHDVGKWVAQANFIKHIMPQKFGPVGEAYKNHAYLSFLTFYNWYKNYGKAREYLNSDEIVATSICILKHHGSLCNFEDLIGKEGFNGQPPEWDRMKGFLSNSGLANIPDQMYAYFGLLDKNTDLLKIPSTVPFRDTKYTVKDPLNFYFETRMAFSAIIAGDKQDAGGYGYKKSYERQLDDNSPRRKERFFAKYESKLNKYMEGLQKNHTPLNTVRTEIREYSQKSIRQNLKLGKRVFSLTGPTGCGKTLIFLYLALEIIKHAGKSMNIIYAVPFLSITEQVFDLCTKVFGKTYGLRRIDSKSGLDESEDDSFKRLRSVFSFYLKKVTNKIKPLLNLDTDADRVLNDEFSENTFDFPFITTTFVQLFEVFTTRSNKGLIKYSNLKNCIFLIDELQALPPRLYTFFTAVLDEHCRRYNCYAVEGTGTMPCFKIHDPAALKLFKNYKMPAEISDISFYDRDIFNRYSIHTINPEISRSTLSTDVLSRDNSCLVILNTVKDSIAVYHILKESCNPAGYEIILLNSWFYADARLVKLKRATELLESRKKNPSAKKVILVTTQLVEAGVDIDFPVVYRDIAPLPNIIQSAGRCNRNGFYDHGTVIVFRLKVEGDKRIRAKFIYNGLDSPFLDFSIELFFLSGKTAFQEKELMIEQKRFFEVIISERTKFGAWVNSGDSQKNSIASFVDLINRSKFGDIGKFKIIPPETHGDQIRFYVPVDSKDESFKKLLQYGMDILEVDQGDGEDRLRQAIRLKREQRLHIKKMSRRMVQAIVKDDVDLSKFVVSTETYMHMHELKPGFYSEELGLLLE